MTVYSFPPVSTRSSRILILGSMPGEKSLTKQQYYAHPQNSFWPIMSALFNAPAISYGEKLDLIRNNKLALWDVLKTCTREGSLDQAIDKNSIVPNDFADFLDHHRDISHILFNGGAAHDIFMRHVWKNLPEDLKARVTLQKLPSSSPAMASLSRLAKTQIWQDAIRRAQAPRSHHADGA